MKSLIFLILSSLLFSGCASRSTTNISPHKPQFGNNLTLQEKRNLIAALQGQINQHIDYLYRVQLHLAELPYEEQSDTNKLKQARESYQSGAQSRDLDRTIKILNDAINQLAAENAELIEKYGISQGPY